MVESLFLKIMLSEKLKESTLLFLTAMICGNQLVIILNFT